MQLTFTQQLPTKFELLILPCYEGKSGPEPLRALTMPQAQGDFKGKEGELLLLYPTAKGQTRLLLLGLGKEQKRSKEGLRKAFAAAAKLCQMRKIEEIVALVPKEAGPALEGLMLANYLFDYKTGAKEERPRLLKKMTVVGAEERAMVYGKQLPALMEAVYFARDLVNGNADAITPQTLAKTAREIKGVKVTVLDKKRLLQEKLGLLLAVGQGSKVDPALILLEYRGNPKSKETTALIGKGVTYDTGGLNLKPTGSMETMKCDMSGAAAVLGTLKAAVALKLKVNLVGVIATTENAIGPHSYKPGDVYTSYSGKTVEITNTDAEGRLILADALSYVQKRYKPRRMIDLATLTGGVVVALGEEVTGFFANDEALARELFEAGEKTGERLWRLPLYPEYRELMNSTIADIKNSGERKASPIQGAIFLNDFIEEKTPWAHLDIAGTAYLSSPRHYHTTHATGVGVRLLIEYLTCSISSE